MSATVDREEQIHCTVWLALAICLIKPLVTVLRAAPDLVFNATMNIVLRVGLYNKESRVGRVQIEFGRIVVVLAAQLIEHRVRGICRRHSRRLLLMRVLNHRSRQRRRLHTRLLH